LEGRDGAPAVSLPASSPSRCRIRCADRQNDQHNHRQGSRRGFAANVGSRRKKNYAAKGRKEPKAVRVAAFVKTRPPRSARHRKDLTTEVTKESRGSRRFVFILLPSVSSSYLGDLCGLFSSPQRGDQFIQLVRDRLQFRLRRRVADGQAELVDGVGVCAGASLRLASRRGRCSRRRWSLRRARRGRPAGLGRRCSPLQQTAHHAAQHQRGVARNGSHGRSGHRGRGGVWRIFLPSIVSIQSIFPGLCLDPCRHGVSRSPCGCAAWAGRACVRIRWCAAHARMSAHVGPAVLETHVAHENCRAPESLGRVVVGAARWGLGVASGNSRAARPSRCSSCRSWFPAFLMPAPAKEVSR